MAFHSSKRGHTHKKKHFRERKFQDQLIIPDEKKIIKAKRIDHTNLVSVFEMLEAKEKDKK